MGFMHASAISAASRLNLFHTPAASLGCISAVSRLYLGCISQVQLDGEPEDDWEVIPAGNGFWRLRGDKVERLAAMTNWDYSEAQARS